MNVPVIVIDGVTELPPEANGGVVVGGSNATAYAAYFSAKAGARAAIHHDCGIGRDEAGVRGLPWADQHGMAMAAVAADSARVGDAADMLKRGIISRANKLAAACGVENGQTVAQALERLKSAPWPHDTNMETPVERRTFVHGVLCIGSISLGTPEDAGLVVASGSHGGATAAPMTRAFRPGLSSSMTPVLVPIVRASPAFPYSVPKRSRRDDRRGFGVYRRRQVDADPRHYLGRERNGAPTGRQGRGDGPQRCANRSGKILNTPCTDQARNAKVQDEELQWNRLKRGHRQ